MWVGSRLDCRKVYKYSQIAMDEPETDPEVARLMEDHMVDDDVAEKAQELIEVEGLDEDEAIELAEEL